ncbi:TolC family protein [Nitrogeniibacter mangrovi]|uniref:TolC family protein n=1 Tax=Nitrogeniibacter mangrovi TaxID=2016596 RepID=A0A6C1BAQ7_9RHOO|nr:TolC family protein [Nitrogeniibacter mangrovi]QID19354.1 TolC family protein [Nitrogeniibacter mangrovi]
MKPTTPLLPIVALTALLLGAPAHAADTPADPALPDAALVARVLLQSPMVQAADARIRVATARERELTAGPHEWTVELSGQRRRANPSGAPSERFNEWGAAIDRTQRLPGKAALDAQLGAGGVDLAQVARGDALHQAARDLLGAWFEWLRGVAAVDQWTAQIASLEAQAQAVARRQALGDAARLDAVQAQAAVAQARAELSSAVARRDAAAELLRRRYPALPLATPAQIGEPPALDSDAQAWIDAMLEHNHELRLARGHSRQARLGARRAGRERTPDPTLGLFVSSERGGEEKVIGARLSIPLPGGGRRARADAAVAEADMAAREEAAALQRATADAATAVHGAATARQAWLASRQASEQLGQAAELTARAYRLGEGSFDALLLAQRRAREAALATRLLQLDALERHDRVLLDAHRLWALDGADDAPADASGMPHPDTQGAL